MAIPKLKQLGFKQLRPRGWYLPMTGRPDTCFLLACSRYQQWRAWWQGDPAGMRFTLRRITLDLETVGDWRNVTSEEVTAIIVAVRLEQ